MARRETTRITFRVAARRAGLLPRTVRRYVRRGLVGELLSEETRGSLFDIVVGIEGRDHPRLRDHVRWRE